MRIGALIVMVASPALAVASWCHVAWPGEDGHRPVGTGVLWTVVSALVIWSVVSGL